MARPAKAFAWSRPHGEGALAIALLVVAVIAFVKLALRIDRPIVDDALISIGYARSLADGDGLRATPYSQISEGFSNPSWTLVLAFFEKLHVNSMRPAKTLGMLLVALSLVLVFLWGPLSQRRKIQLEDALAPLLACSNATLAYWSLGGLETGILVFFCALFGLLLFMKRTARVAVLLGLTGAALVLTRPEGALYVGVLGLPWFIDWALSTRLRPRRADWLAVSSLVLPLVLYVAMRRMYFGSWLPNTYYAKQSWFLNPIYTRESAVIYVDTFVKAVRPMAVACVAGVGLSMLGGLKTAKTACASGLLAISIFFFAWYVHADWMKEWRFLAPAVLFLAYPATGGVSGLRRALGRGFFRHHSYLRAGLHVVVGGAAVLVLALTSQIHHARWAAVKAVGGDTPREAELRPEYGADIREMVRPFAMTHPLVASPDMGYLAIGLREAELMDLAGLTDVAIARHYGNPPAMRDYFMNEGLPTMLLVWGPSNYLWSMTDVLGQYRSLKSDSYKMYAKLSADTDERCPDGKSAALRDTSEQMIEKLSADLQAGAAVKGLARWRCYFMYRKDAELPSEAQRVAFARTAQSAAEDALAQRQGEPALRAYSLCAVVGAGSYLPSTPCRMRAELIRGRLFPRPPVKK